LGGLESLGAPSSQQHDPEIFLREIHEFEIQRERHRLVERFPCTQGRHGDTELFLGSAFSRPTVFRQTPDRLHRVERLPTFQSRDDAPQGIAERPNLRSKKRDLT
jgi:hypothetical protein